MIIIEYGIVWDSGKRNLEVRGELSICKDKESINMFVRFLGFCIVKFKKINIWCVKPYQVPQWYNHKKSDKIIRKLKYCKTRLNK